jgi:hypothetical protein
LRHERSKDKEGTFFVCALWLRDDLKSISEEKLNEKKVLDENGKLRENEKQIPTCELGNGKTVWLLTRTVQIGFLLHKGTQENKK